MGLKRWLIACLVLGFLSPLWAQTVGARNQFKVARTFFEGGNAQRALEEVNKALALDPLYDDAVWLRGLIYYDLEQFDEAEQDFLQVLEWQPQFLQAHQRLGMLYLVTEQWERGEKHFQKMQLVPGGKGAAFYCLGVIAYAQKDLEKAEGCWKQAVAADPKAARSYNNLGILHLLAGRPYEALAQFRTAVQRDDKNPFYLLNLSWALLECHQEGLARTRLEESQELANLRHDVGFVAAATLAYLDHEDPKAIKLCELALEKNDDFIHAYLLKGRALERQGKKELARLVFAQALDKDPNVVEAAKAVERLQFSLPHQADDAGRDR